jgi:hypothetical protein
MHARNRSGGRVVEDTECAAVAHPAIHKQALMSVIVFCVKVPGSCRRPSWLRCLAVCWWACVEPFSLVRGPFVLAVASCKLHAAVTVARVAQKLLRYPWPTCMHRNRPNACRSQASSAALFSSSRKTPHATPSIGELVNTQVDVYDARMCTVNVGTE